MPAMPARTSRPPKRSTARLDRAPNVGSLGDVAGGLDRPVLRAQLADGPLERLRLDVEQDQAGALGRQALRRAALDPLRGAGDQRGHRLESAHPLPPGGVREGGRGWGGHVRRPSLADVGDALDLDQHPTAFGAGRCRRWSWPGTARGSGAGRPRCSGGTSVSPRCTLTLTTSARVAPAAARTASMLSIDVGLLLDRVTLDLAVRADQPGAGPRGKPPACHPWE